ncbi:MAG TPA: Rne/Rng family ribonuclease [Acidobacteriota bacterium]
MSDPTPGNKRSILIQAAPHETRVAILEDQQLRELLLEPRHSKLTVGSLYKGRVIKVLPGMQSAFVNIGADKDAFLYAADIAEDVSGFAELFGDDEADTHPRHARHQVPIDDLVRVGQEILVQVIKQPMGSKGTRVSSFITLPGQYLVLMPTTQHIGVSRKIEDPSERDRLRALAAELQPTGGLIVRTSAAGRGAAELHAELDKLAQHWNAIRAKSDRASAPSLIHQELDLPLKVLRDHIADELDRILIDEPETHRRCLEFLEASRPDLVERTELEPQPGLLLERYGVEAELERSLRAKVWLKSGGYLVIQPTEAVVVIDVNTGKFVGTDNLEDTFLRTNLEAVKEIARQLLLRDLGGIIVIDLIDMAEAAHREEVLALLTHELRRDHAHIQLLGINEFGLVHLTRQRVKQSLDAALSQPCPACGGQGRIASVQATLSAIRNQVLRLGREAIGDRAGMILRLHPQVAAALQGAHVLLLEEFERVLRGRLSLRPDPALAPDRFELILGP